MSETKNLRLFKHNEPLETNENKFDIDLALNQNWDKIEEFAGMVNEKVIELEDKNEEQDFNLQEQNTKLEKQIKKDRENMINLEVEGQSIHIEDSSDLEGKLEVLGNVEQEVREGYNLYDYMSRVIATTKGLNVTKDAENGYLMVNGTPETDYTSITAGTNITDKIKDKTTYSLWQEKYDGKLFLQVNAKKKDASGYDYFSVTSAKKDFTVDKSKYGDYTMVIQTGLKTQAGTFNNYKNRYMLYEGTEEKPYEQYGASPSPEYPSEIRAVGDKGSVEIKKQNKNSLKNTAKTQTVNGVTFTVNEDGTVIANGTAETESSLTINSQINLGKGEHCVSGCPKGGGNNTYRIGLWNNTWESIALDLGDPNNFTLQQDTEAIKCAINIKQGTTLNNVVFKPMIEKGTVKTEYVEHQEQTKILPIQKPMLEGDYFIKEVDGWKEVHNWGKKVFDGTENWDTYEDTQPNTIGFGYNYRDGQKNFVGLSNYFIPYNTDYMPGRLDKDIEGLVIRYNYIKISRFKREIPNVESLKKWLKDIYDLGKPLYVYYKLDVPTKLPCTPEQTKILDELDNFQTYKPVTNITTDSIAKIKLKYIADTKTYVDNKTSNLEQQVSVINQLLSTTRTSSVLLDNLQKDIESEVL